MDHSRVENLQMKNFSQTTSELGYNCNLNLVRISGKICFETLSRLETVTSDKTTVSNFDMFSKQILTESHRKDLVIIPVGRCSTRIPIRILF